MAQVASFPGDSSGASGASSDSEEESSSLASASSPAKLPDFVCQAAEDGDIETVNAWLRTEPDVNAEDNYGYPLLFWAATANGTINATHVDLARRLLALGADVSASNPDNGVTALHCALHSGMGPQASEMVRLLLLAGADVNATSTGSRC